MKRKLKFMVGYYKPQGESKPVLCLLLGSSPIKYIPCGIVFRHYEPLFQDVLEFCDGNPIPLYGTKQSFVELAQA